MRRGRSVFAVSNTMDNDATGAERCIGFSTCLIGTIELVRRLRTSAGSRERCPVVEVFDHYGGSRRWCRR